MSKLNWDRDNDVLYINLADTNDSYGDEIENGLVILKDLETDAITGITIFDFKHRYQNSLLNSLKLPIKIDFTSKPYQNIINQLAKS